MEFRRVAPTNGDQMSSLGGVLPRPLGTSSTSGFRFESLSQNVDIKGHTSSEWASLESQWTKALENRCQEMHQHMEKQLSQVTLEMRQHMDRQINRVTRKMLGVSMQGMALEQEMNIQRHEPPGHRPYEQGPLLESAIAVERGEARKMVRNVQTGNIKTNLQLSNEIWTALNSLRDDFAREMLKASDDRKKIQIYWNSLQGLTTLTEELSKDTAEVQATLYQMGRSQIEAKGHDRWGVKSACEEVTRFGHRAQLAQMYRSNEESLSQVLDRVQTLGDRILYLEHSMHGLVGSWDNPISLKEWYDSIFNGIGKFEKIVMERIKNATQNCLPDQAMNELVQKCKNVAVAEVHETERASVSKLEDRLSIVEQERHKDARMLKNMAQQLNDFQLAVSQFSSHSNSDAMNNITQRLAVIDAIEERLATMDEASKHHKVSVESQLDRMREDMQSMQDSIREALMDSVCKEIHSIHSQDSSPRGDMEGIVEVMQKNMRRAMEELKSDVDQNTRNICRSSFATMRQDMEEDMDIKSLHRERRNFVNLLEDMEILKEKSSQENKDIRDKMKVLEDRLTQEKKYLEDSSKNTARQQIADLKQELTASAKRQLASLEEDVLVRTKKEVMSVRLALEEESLNDSMRVKMQLEDNTQKQLMNLKSMEDETRKSIMEVKADVEKHTQEQIADRIADLTADIGNSTKQHLMAMTSDMKERMAAESDAMLQLVSGLLQESGQQIEESVLETSKKSLSMSMKVCEETAMNAEQQLHQRQQGLEDKLSQIEKEMAKKSDQDTKLAEAREIGILSATACQELREELAKSTSLMADEVMQRMEESIAGVREIAQKGLGRAEASEQVANETSRVIRKELLEEITGSMDQEMDTRIKRGITLLEEKFLGKYQKQSADLNRGIATATTSLEDKMAESLESSVTGLKLEFANQSQRDSDAIRAEVEEKVLFLKSEITGRVEKDIAWIKEELYGKTCQEVASLRGGLLEEIVRKFETDFAKLRQELAEKDEEVSDRIQHVLDEKVSCTREDIVRKYEQDFGAMQQELAGDASEMMIAMEKMLLARGVALGEELHDKTDREMIAMKEDLTQSVMDESVARSMHDDGLRREWQDAIETMNDHFSSSMVSAQKTYTNRLQSSIAEVQTQLAETESKFARWEKALGHVLEQKDGTMWAATDHLKALTYHQTQTHQTLAELAERLSAMDGKPNTVALTNPFPQYPQLTHAKSGLPLSPVTGGKEAWEDASAHGTIPSQSQPRSPQDRCHTPSMGRGAVPWQTPDSPSFSNISMSDTVLCNVEALKREMEHLRKEVDILMGEEEGTQQQRKTLTFRVGALEEFKERAEQSLSQSQHEHGSMEASIASTLINTTVTKLKADMEEQIEELSRQIAENKKADAIERQIQILGDQLQCISQRVPDHEPLGLSHGGVSQDAGADHAHHLSPLDTRIDSMRKEMYSYMDQQMEAMRASVSTTLNEGSHGPGITRSLDAMEYWKARVDARISALDERLTERVPSKEILEAMNEDIQEARKWKKAGNIYTEFITNALEQMHRTRDAGLALWGEKQIMMTTVMVKAGLDQAFDNQNEQAAWMDQSLRKEREEIEIEIADVYEKMAIMDERCMESFEELEKKWEVRFEEAKLDIEEKSLVLHNSLSEKSEREKEIFEVLQGAKETFDHLQMRILEMETEHGLAAKKHIELEAQHDQHILDNIQAIAEFRGMLEEFNTKVSSLDTVSALVDKVDNKVGSLESQAIEDRQKVNDDLEAMAKSLEESLSEFGQKVDDKVGSLESQVIEDRQKVNDDLETMTKSLEESLSEFGQKVDDAAGSTDQKIQESIAALDEKVMGTLSKMGTSISTTNANVDERVSTIEEKMSGTSSRETSVDQRLKIMDQSVITMGEQLEVMEQEMNIKLEEKCDALNKEIKAKIDGKFDLCEENLEEQWEALKEELQDSLDGKLEGLEDSLDDKMDAVLQVFERRMDKSMDARFETSGHNSKAKAEGNDADERWQNLDARVGAMVGKVESLENSLSALDSEFRIMNESVTILDNTAASMGRISGKLHAIDSDMAVIGAKVEVIDSRLESKVEPYLDEQLGRKLQAMEGAVIQLEEKVDGTTSSVSELNERIDNGSFNNVKSSLDETWSEAMEDRLGQEREKTIWMIAQRLSLIAEELTDRYDRKLQSFDERISELSTQLDDTNDHSLAKKISDLSTELKDASVANKVGAIEDAMSDMEENLTLMDQEFNNKFSVVHKKMDEKLSLMAEQMLLLDQHVTRKDLNEATEKMNSSLSSFADEMATFGQVIKEKDTGSIVDQEVILAIHARMDELDNKVKSSERDDRLGEISSRMQTINQELQDVRAEIDKRLISQSEFDQHLQDTNKRMDEWFSISNTSMEALDNRTNNILQVLDVRQNEEVRMNDEGLNRLEQRLKALINTLDEGLTTMDSKLATMDDRFGGIDEEISMLRDKFSADMALLHLNLIEKIETMDSTTYSIMMDEKVVTINDRLSALDQVVAKVDEGVNEAILTLDQDLKARIQEMESREESDHHQIRKELKAMYKKFTNFKQETETKENQNPPILKEDLDAVRAKLTDQLMERQKFNNDSLRAHMEAEMRMHKTRMDMVEALIKDETSTANSTLQSSVHELREIIRETIMPQAKHLKESLAKLDTDVHKEMSELQGPMQEMSVLISSAMELVRGHSGQIRDLENSHRHIIGTHSSQLQVLDALQGKWEVAQQSLSVLQLTEESIQALRQDNEAMQDRMDKVEKDVATIQSDIEEGIRRHMAWQKEWDLMTNSFKDIAMDHLQILQQIEASARQGLQQSEAMEIELAQVSLGMDCKANSNETILHQKLISMSHEISDFRQDSSANQTLLMEIQAWMQDIQAHAVKQSELETRCAPITCSVTQLRQELYKLESTLNQKLTSVAESNSEEMMRLQLQICRQNKPCTQTPSSSILQA